MELHLIKKDDIKIVCEKIISELDSGNINPLDVLANVKTYEKIFDKIKSELTKHALIEADKYSEKEFEFKGVKFQKTEAGVVYDYSNCGHKEYNDICKKINELIEQKKEYEKLLQAVKQMTPMVSIHGELMEIFPPVKRSTSILKTIL